MGRTRSSGQANEADIRRCHPRVISARPARGMGERQCFDRASSRRKWPYIKRFSARPFPGRDLGRDPFARSLLCRRQRGKWGGPGPRGKRMKQTCAIRSTARTAFLPSCRSAARTGKGGLPPFAYPPFFRGYCIPTPARGVSSRPAPPPRGPCKIVQILWGESDQGGLPCTRLRLRSALCGGAEKKLHFCLFRLAPNGDAGPSA